MQEKKCTWETLLLLIWITLTILMCNFEVCMVECTKHVKQVWIFSNCGSITIFKNKSPLPFKHVCMRHTLGFIVGSQSLPFCCSYSVDNLHPYPEIIIIVPKRLDTENKWKKKKKDCSCSATTAACTVHITVVWNSTYQVKNVTSGNRASMTNLHRWIARSC